MPKPRARDVALPFPGTPGPINGITDFPGVTAVRPRQDAGTSQPVWAGQFTLNGNGEMTGTPRIQDAGQFIGPLAITNTHGVTRWMIAPYDAFFAGGHGRAMPVVAQTHDGTLNDSNARHVTPVHAIDSVRAAKGGAVEKAVINAIEAGVDVEAVQPRGLMVWAIDTEKLAAMFRGGGCLASSWKCRF